jgi:hypothetical protein
MKQIHTHGGTNVRKQLAKSAINWYIDMYLPKVRKLHIDLCFNHLDNLNGLCTQMEKRKFNIQIDERLSMDDMVTTVMHEMIHVKQYVRNELCDMPSGTVRWKSRPIDPENLDYWDHPWEKEAHKYDEILACAFMVDMDI